MSCVGPRHFPSLKGVKILHAIAQVCFQMQFLPSAAANLWTVAAGCLGQSVPWDICQCNVNYFQYLPTDAIRKGKVGVLLWFLFICIHLSGSSCDWWIDLNWKRWSWRLIFEKWVTAFLSQEDYVVSFQICPKCGSSAGSGFQRCPSCSKSSSRSFTEQSYRSTSRF